MRRSRKLRTVGFIEVLDEKPLTPLSITLIMVVDMQMSKTPLTSTRIKDTRFKKLSSSILCSVKITILSTLLLF